MYEGFCEDTTGKSTHLKFYMRFDPTEDKSQIGIIKGVYVHPVSKRMQDIEGFFVRDDFQEFRFKIIGQLSKSNEYVGKYKGDKFGKLKGHYFYSLSEDDEPEEGQRFQLKLIKPALKA